MGAKYISSSLGNIVPNVSGAYTQNPGYFGGPFDVGTIVCGDDTFELSQTREMGSNTVVIKKNGVQSSTFPNGNMDTSGFVGFYATLNGTEVKVYYIWTDGNPGTNVDGQTSITAQGGLNYTYGATLLGTYTTSILLTTWDDPDQGDPNYDPSQPQGGENADIYPSESDPCQVTGLPDDLLFDDSDDISHSNVKMISAYVMTAKQVKDMGKLFWKTGQDSFLERISEVFKNGSADPLASISGLIRLPINQASLPATAHSSTPNIWLGGQLVSYGSGETYETAVASMWLIGRYVTLTYGKDINLRWGTYYDFENTSISLYLPYVGQIPLDTKQIMQGRLFIRYVVDVLTGDLLATVEVYKAQNNNYGTVLSSVIGRYKGNCAMPVPYSRGDTSANAQNIFNGMMGFVTSGISTVGGAIAQNPIAVAGGLAGMTNAAVSTLMNANTPPKAQKGGALSSSGVSGWFDVQYPYLIVERDVPMYPDGWRAIDGAEQNATFTVSSLSGFTKFDKIHVELANASDDENAEIESYLKNGIII